MLNKSKKYTKHYGHILVKKDGFDVIECERCGFKHIVPLFTEKQLEDFYKKDFYKKEKPNYLKDAEEDKKWWDLTYKNNYNIFTKHVKGKKLLDIGSGPGYFILFGKKHGWEVTGIEPSLYAWEYSKKMGLRVINGFFDDKIIETIGKFDVINISFVLEHIPDPFNFINRLKKILNPGGIICITCPNDFNPLQSILIKNKNFNPWWVVPTHHINYFDFGSMKSFLESVGFDIVDSFGTFPMEMFLLAEDNYVDNRKMGRTCHSKRKKIEETLYASNEELLTDIYRNLSKLNIGRELVFFAKLKKDE